MNPLDLPGPQFLLFYLAVIALTVNLAVRVRWLIEKQSDSDTACSAQLDQYEFAMLSGGKEAAFSTAVAALSHDGALALSDRSGYIERVITERPLGHPFEEALLNRVSETPKCIYSVYISLLTPLDKMAARLANFGLLTSDSQLVKAQFIPFFIAIAPVVCIAIPKSLIGVLRDKPVGFLVALCMLQLVIALVFLIRSRKCTSAGTRLLEQAKQENSALSYNYLTSPMSMSAKDLALGAALFGSASLLPDVYTQVRNSLKPVSTVSSGGGSCSGGSCGGGGCGGGCGGCGGCGG